MRRWTPPWLACVALLALVFSSCKKEAKSKVAAEPAAAAPAASAAPAKATAAKRPRPPAPGGPRVGIPECDNYLDKYGTCLVEHVPESTRPLMAKSLSDTREAWRRAASEEGGRAQLLETCKSAAAAARRAMKAFGCEW